MSKELTEQWYDGKLPQGWYYVMDCNGKEWFRYLSSVKPDIDLLKCFKEVLGPVPGYMDCKGLIYDSIALDKKRKRIDELVSKIDKLEKKLEIALTALKEISHWSPRKDERDERAAIALKEIEDIQ